MTASTKMAGVNDITQAELLEALDYEPETGKFRWRHRADRSRYWNTRYAGKVTGCIGSGDYLRIRFNGRLYAAHRFAWLYQTGEWPRHEIDHVNGDRRDNRFANLREATHAQNNTNVGKRSDNTSGEKGVSWNKRDRRWVAYIDKDSRRIPLGCFINFNDAVQVRRDAVDFLHGEFKNYG